jgi:hypothetical protein
LWGTPREIGVSCRGQTGDRQRISGKRRRKVMSVPSLRLPFPRRQNRKEAPKLMYIMALGEAMHISILRRLVPLLFSVSFRTVVCGDELPAPSN